MRLLHKNYAVTTKLSNPISIVSNCPKDTSAVRYKMRNGVTADAEMRNRQCVTVTHFIPQYNC